MWTVEFWKATAERVVATAAQALIAFLTVTSADGIDWALALKGAGIAALLALVKCLAAASIGHPGPSLANETLTTAVAATRTVPEDSAEFRAGPAADVPEDTAVTVEPTVEVEAVREPVEPLDGPNEDYPARHRMDDPPRYTGDSKTDGTYHGS